MDVLPVQVPVVEVLLHKFFKMIKFLFIAVLLLTYSNGANDNFKSATLWGSGTLNYKTALTLAAIATFAGSVCSYFLQLMIKSIFKHANPLIGKNQDELGTRFPDMSRILFIRNKNMIF